MNDIDEVLTRGVETILPSKKGLASLMAKKKITLYQGFDPTAESLHIGHFIGLRKLAQFQELGHKVIFLIGDFTATIGDPTDKTAARKKLTKKEVLANLKDYKKQAGKVLKFTGPNAARVAFNSSWLSKLSFEEILELASFFTVQQIIEREMYQERLRSGRAIFLHEFLYPLMQGYDSVAMDVDLEIGGSDQLFNMLAGRELLKKMKNKEKFILSMKLLVDPSGRKMGKTEGNAVWLNDDPNEIFGKIMSWPDNFIGPGIELLTDLPLKTAEGNFMDTKKKLGLQVVKQIYSEKEALKAQEEFEKTFQRREAPSKMPVVKVKESVMPLLDVIFATKEVSSRSEAKRLIKEGAVEVGGKVIREPSQSLTITKKGTRIKIGKKRFTKVRL